MDFTRTKLIDLKYNLYSLTMKPYADKAKEYDSVKIVKEVISHLVNIKQQGKGLLIDRNENRKDLSPRELFLFSAVLMGAERRSRCTMALIRKGKKPMFMKKGTFNLEEIENIGDMVEVTHFFVDFSTETPIICVENNPHGPNFVDIEYYFKRIGRDELQLAKTTELGIFMKNSIEKTLGSIKNVLRFDIKLKTANLKHIDDHLKKNFFQGFDTLSSIYKPESLRIDVFFKKQGKTVKLPTENKIATNMFSKALAIFKEKPEETDLYDNFVVVYEDAKGVEETFNLLKDKTVFTKKIEEGKDLSQKESYALIRTDLTTFINSL